jgi:hypothetical protein
LLYFERNAVESLGVTELLNEIFDGNGNHRASSPRCLSEEGGERDSFCVNFFAERQNLTGERDLALALAE